MIIFRYLEKRSMLSRKAKFNNLEKEKIEFFFFFYGWHWSSCNSFLINADASRGYPTVLMI